MATRGSSRLMITSNSWLRFYAGDYIEATGEIVSVGKYFKKKWLFEAKKVIAPRPDISDSAADVLAEPIVVCRASGTCV